MERFCEAAGGRAGGWAGAEKKKQILGREYRPGNKRLFGEREREEEWETIINVSCRGCFSVSIQSACPVV